MKLRSWFVGTVVLYLCAALSGCQPNVTVPDVVGKTQAEATVALANVKLVVGTITEAYSATVAAGLVISQTPAAGTNVKSDSAVELAISKGSESVMVTVPDVVGETQATAQTAIAGAGLTIGTITQAFSSAVPAGTVISQTPAAGTQVSAGSPVTLAISKGPRPGTVPDVVGQTQAAAQTAIAGVGLTLGTVTQAFSATVPAGIVISQTPAAGVQAGLGDTVALVVSKGPESVKVTVPNVTGQTQIAASSAITSAGLVVGTVTQAFSMTVPSGSVISQTPAAGVSVSSGSSVALVVSKGPESVKVTVPNAVGQTQAAASSGITAVGLVVGAVTQAFSTTVPSGSVISQTPAAGALVNPGSSVALVVSKGLGSSVQVPNVVGQAQAAASTAIVGAGLLVGTVTQVFSETVPSGSVVSETPAAGTSVNLGSAVNLSVSKGPQPIWVPNVVGLTQAAAGTAITTALLSLGTVVEVYNGVTPVGSVVSQSPVAGTSVTAGTAVALDVSKGPEFVDVPNVVGLTQAAATAALTNALLSLGVVTHLYSSSAPVGQVLNQNPVAGTTVGQHTAVRLGVSVGPQPVKSQL